ncbi:hypothetical protein TWF696_006250 [Orbilia brochopaga]|uniref:Uncharacterized protein n=1 Tax=Orbilia brochopaga TaxID=3140254 RepID=A0AAV9UYZ1_9PEZI
MADGAEEEDLYAWPPSLREPPLAFTGYADFAQWSRENNFLRRLSPIEEIADSTSNLARQGNVTSYILGEPQPPYSLTAEMLNNPGIEWGMATSHIFLDKAGTASYSRTQFRDWILQTRHFAHIYIDFMNRLKAKLTHVATTGQMRFTPELYNVAMATVEEVLTNTREDLRQYNYALEHYFNWPAHEWVRTSKTIKKYDHVLQEVSGEVPVDDSKHVQVVDDFLVLWQVQKSCYESWTFARGATEVDVKTIMTHWPPSRKRREKLKAYMQDVVFEVFIANWGTPEFGEYVDSLGAMVDRIARAERRMYGPLATGNCKHCWISVAKQELSRWPKFETF